MKTDARRRRESFVSRAAPRRRRYLIIQSSRGGFPDVPSRLAAPIGTFARLSPHAFLDIGFSSIGRSGAPSRSHPVRIFLAVSGYQSLFVIVCGSLPDRRTRARGGGERRARACEGGKRQATATADERMDGRRDARWDRRRSTSRETTTPSRRTFDAPRESARAASGPARRGRSRLVAF